MPAPRIFVPQKVKKPHKQAQFVKLISGLVGESKNVPSVLISVVREVKLLPVTIKTWGGTVNGKLLVL